MNAMRRSAGLGIILLASVMLVLCLAGIVGVWFAKSRVDTIGVGIFKAAGSSLEFMDGKLDRIENAFKNGNRRIGLISNAVNHLPGKDPEIKTETMSLLKSLDEEVHAGIIGMKAAVFDLTDGFQWWTMLGAILLNLLLAWFAASQIGMIVHGLPLVRRKVF
jgi:hypothetical protein